VERVEKPCALVYCAVLIVATLDSSNASDSGKYFRCFPATPMVAVANVLAHQYPGAIQVSIGATKSLAELNVPFSTSACHYVDSDQRARDVETVPGGAIVALVSALRYRAAHGAWPLGQVNTESQNAYINVDFRTRDSKFGVIIVEGRTGYTSSIDGCSVAEAYRVDPNSLRVLPYDSCRAPGVRFPGLLHRFELPR
jgi:hypothetical protein